MIRKLRTRLIRAAMISLLAVLAVIIGAAAALNYKNIVQEADQKLEILVANTDKTVDQLGDSFRKFSPDAKYEMRYFTAQVSEDGTIQSVNVSQIAAVDAEQAAAYAEEIVSGGTESGFIDSYRYLMYQDASGTSTVCFLSCARDLASLKSFVINGVLMALAGSLAVLFLLILLSGRIVKPVSDSYENQKRFITDAGHELRTPLTIISADAEVLEMDFGESEWLEDIRSQTKRLSDLTNDLVFLTRMEEQPQTDQTDLPLSSLVRQTLENYQPAAASEGKTLTASVESDLVMRGDEKNIQTLLSILLDNAMKYTDERGIIHLTLEKWRGQTRVQIYNTTESMKKDSLQHLFDRFYRTDASRNSQTGGHGLGLSIAAAIAAAHKGKITASTEDEKSLLITVTFPG